MVEQEDNDRISIVNSVNVCSLRASLLKREVECVQLCSLFVGSKFPLRQTAASACEIDFLTKANRVEMP